MMFTDNLGRGRPQCTPYSKHVSHQCILTSDPQAPHTQPNILCISISVPTTEQKNITLKRLCPELKGREVLDSKGKTSEMGNQGVGNPDFVVSGYCVGRRSGGRSDRGRTRWESGMGYEDEVMRCKMESSF